MESSSFLISCHRPIPPKRDAVHLHELVLMSVEARPRGLSTAFSGAPRPPQAFPGGAFSNGSGLRGKGMSVPTLVTGKAEEIGAMDGMSERAVATDTQSACQSL